MEEIYMSNPLTETTEILNDNGKDWSDVLWIGSKFYYMDIESFKKSIDIEYEPVSEMMYMNVNLKIVGDNWWLELQHSAGWSWWEFKTLPVKPDELTNRDSDIFCGKTKIMKHKDFLMDIPTALSVVKDNVIWNYTRKYHAFKQKLIDSKKRLF